MDEIKDTKVLELELREKHKAILYDNGSIFFRTPDGEHFTSAAEIAYVLQEFQNKFGGIPVKMDFSNWKGVTGTKVE